MDRISSSRKLFKKISLFQASLIKDLSKITFIVTLISITRMTLIKIKDINLCSLIVKAKVQMFLKLN